MPFLIDQQLHLMEDLTKKKKIGLKLEEKKVSKLTRHFSI